MRFCLAYERAQGREPQDLSLENLGYDIRSSDRYIEVKGRAGVGPVVLTQRVDLRAAHRRAVLALHRDRGPH